MKRLLILISLILILAACSGDDNNQGNNSEDGESPRLYDWDHSADYIVFRMDQIPSVETEAYITNSIPICTIWGDGRLVWVNYVSSTAEVLEARLTTEQIRGFIEEVIRFGFYGWEEDIVPPIAENPTLQTITLNLFAEERTVERYGDWPVNAFDRIAEICSNLSSERALFVPTGGWARAYPIEFDNQLPSQEWPRHAPFRMVDLAASDTPIWVEGAWAAELWNYTREISLVQVTELGNAFEVSLEVPEISRSSPPPPVVVTESEN